MSKEGPPQLSPREKYIQFARGLFESEGTKVVLGKYPESGSVFILPAGSEDIEQDSIGPWQLQIGEGMDERLKNLINGGREVEYRCQGVQGQPQPL